MSAGHGRATLALALAFGCGCAPGGSLDTGAAPGTDPALAAADYTRPWLLIDQVGSGKTIDAVTQGPPGYLAITHVPTLDSKGQPARNNIAALSPDGVNWSESAIVPDGHYVSVAFGAGRYVAVGGAFSGGGTGLVLASTDGRQWTTTAEVGELLRRVRFTAGGFVAVGMYGLVITSVDGVHWTPAPEQARGLLWDGTFGAGRFVAVGQTVSLGSRDGRSWTVVTCGPQLPCQTVIDPSGGSHAILQLTSAEFGNGVFIADGVVGRLRSTDGESWTRLGDTSNTLGFGGGQFLSLLGLGAENPPTAFRVSTSGDGLVWTERTTAQVGRSEESCATARCLLLPEALLLIPPAP